MNHCISTGELGTVVVIYKEGDDLINSTSEYLATVLSHLPTVVNHTTTNSTNNNSRSPSSLLLPKLSSRFPPTTPSPTPRKNVTTLRSSADSALHRRSFEHNLVPGSSKVFSSTLRYCIRFFSSYRIRIGFFIPRQLGKSVNSDLCMCILLH